MSSKDKILKLGVVTPYIRFQMVGGVIESGKPSYFISLENTRTCRKACSFKLTLAYVPDTFRPGEPTLLDQWILNSVREKVTFNYGYYDYLGQAHEQNAVYTGQVYSYTTDIDIASGILTYTLEGSASTVDLSNSMAYIEASKKEVHPSEYLWDNIWKATAGGFKDLRQNYDIQIWDREDTKVFVPAIESRPVLDLIMGQVQTGETTNSGGVVRKDGIVQLSTAPWTKGIEEAYKFGLVSESDYYSSTTALDRELDFYRNGNTNTSSVQSLQQNKRRIEAQLAIPYICYIDSKDVHDGKYGTLHYVKKIGIDTEAVYEYEFGNDVQNSNVINFNITYDGASAIAAASSTDNITSSIGPTGSNQGSSYAIGKTNYLSRNTSSTLAGFDDEARQSIALLADIMVYPFEASMTVIGETEPHNIMDIIYVVIKLNGVEHPSLTGPYQIYDIVDNISESGFTTTFKLIRETTNELAVSNKTENYVTNGEGESQEVQDKISETSTNDSTNTNKIRNQ